MDGRLDGKTGGRMDRPSYREIRDAMSRWRIWKEEDGEEEDDDEEEDDKEEDDKGVGTDVQFPFTQPPFTVHTHPNIRKKWKKKTIVFPFFD